MVLHESWNFFIPVIGFALLKTSFRQSTLIRPIPTGLQSFTTYLSHTLHTFHHPHITIISNLTPLRSQGEQEQTITTTPTKTTAIPEGSKVSHSREATVPQVSQSDQQGPSSGQRGLTGASRNVMQLGLWREVLGAQDTLRACPRMRTPYYNGISTIDR